MMKRMVAIALAGAAGFAVGSRLMRRPYSFAEKVVLVTGGSRGLGLEVARQLADEGAIVALVARDLGELEGAVREIEGRGGRAFAAACDVRDEQQVNDAVGRVLAEFGRIDVLINNAGVIQVGPIENVTIQDFEDAMAVHFWGPLYMIRGVLGHMQRRRAGRIVNIASIGGEVAVPHLAPYCASKYALVGLSDALRSELRASGIQVTTICPFLMRTGSFPHAIFKGQRAKEYTWFGVSDSIPGVTVKSATAARRIVEACRSGQARLTLGWPGKVAVFLNAVVPGWVAFGQSLAGRLLPSAVAGESAGRPGWELEREGAPQLSRLA